MRDQKDRKRALEVVEFWNARLAAFEEPFSVPTVHAALITGHHWMIVACRSCGTVIDLDLRVKRRPPEATILTALRDVCCPRCNGNGRPQIMKLSESASYVQATPWPRRKPGSQAAPAWRTAVGR